MINQAHPKILSRIKMGVETAKAKMSRGEPFTLEVMLIQLLYNVCFYCGGASLFRG